MTTPTEAEIKATLQAEIDEINTALSQIRKAGASYLIMSSAAGGTQRSVTMADYSTLVKHRNDLQRRLDSLSGKRAFMKRIGW